MRLRRPLRKPPVVSLLIGSRLQFRPGGGVVAAKAKRAGDERGGERTRAAEVEASASDERRAARAPAKLPGKVYRAELLRLQEELVKMAEWVRDSGSRVVVVFEGRDAAGKGGAIKRITEHLNPRIARVVALPVPTARQETQWYFQRYVEQLPAGGEIVLLDRSWYNRAGIEKVLGFCTPEQHRRFLRQCPIFERLLVDDGIHLVKYWFSVSDEEQARRFEARIDDPMRRWKLSETDLYSRTRWVDYSRAKDEMFVHTDIPEAPWFVVDADDKRRARINCMAHLLSRIPYVAKRLEPVRLPPRQADEGYVRPARDIYTYVPDHASTLDGG
jgi:polyphosphate kinase